MHVVVRRHRCDISSRLTCRIQGSEACITSVFTCLLISSAPFSYFKRHIIFYVFLRQVCRLNICIQWFCWLGLSVNLTQTRLTLERVLMRKYLDQVGLWEMFWLLITLGRRTSTADDTVSGSRPKTAYGWRNLVDHDEARTCCLFPPCSWLWL